MFELSTQYSVPSNVHVRKCPSHQLRTRFGRHEALMTFLTFNIQPQRCTHDNHARGVSQPANGSNAYNTSRTNRHALTSTPSLNELQHVAHNAEDDGDWNRTLANCSTRECATENTVTVTKTLRRRYTGRRVIVEQEAHGMDAGYKRCRGGEAQRAEGQGQCKWHGTDRATAG